MTAINRYRVTDPETGEPVYRTIGQLAMMAGLTPNAIFKRIKRGVVGDELIKRKQDRAVTAAERQIRAKLKIAARRKYATPCPNCGHVFEVFQPLAVLRRTRAGS